MKHNFTDGLTAVIDGLDVVQCTNIGCNVSRHKRPSGNNIYFSGDIRQKNGFTPACGTKRDNILDIRFKPSISQSLIAKELRTPSDALSGLLTSTEARLAEAIIYLKITYEEMSKAGIKTPGKRMIGTFLISQRFEAWIKEIDQKYNKPCVQKSLNQV